MDQVVRDTFHPEKDVINAGNDGVRVTGLQLTFETTRSHAMQNGLSHFLLIYC